jgi:hypothetical protein
MTPRILIVGALVCLPTACAPSQPQAAEAFYVATDGNDQWSGRLAAPNASHSDGPFATVTRARDAIRELKRQAGGLSGPVTVHIRQGTYFLTEPLVLTPQDSGTSECPVTYAAYRNEKPVVSGGAAITDWQAAQANGHPAWAAHLPAVEQGAWYFRQLFVNNERRPRPRLPKEGLYRFAGLLQQPGSIPWDQGQDRAVFANDDLRAWPNLDDVEVVALHFWVDSRLPVTEVDEFSHVVTFARPSVYRLTDGQTPQGARFYVENVFDAFDTPGQWYLERKSGTLYYLPQEGESPQTAQVVAPRLAQLIRFEGDPDKGEWVEHVHLQGLGLMHSEWTLPANTAGSIQASVLVPGAVVWQGARSCSMRGCTVAHVGSYGIELGAGCDGNAIVGNTICDLGAGGVKIGPGSAHTVLSDNEIYDGGYLFPSAVGVWVGDSGHNEVSHNEVHRFYYTGISVGWVWGYKKSNAVDNHIEYNHIHHIGRGWLSDLGGIYTLGASPGTVLRNNLIHDCWSANGRGRGIYLDEGSSGILVENNVVLRTDDAAIIQNYGRDDQIQNNIFGCGKLCQIRRAQVKGLEGHPSFTFERNIFYFTDGELLGGKWGDGNYAFDDNVYFNAAGRPITFGGQSFAQWQGSGMDLHSVIADPRLADPANNDVTLRPGSPALSLGFKPIDLSQVGPRRRTGGG